MRFVLVCLILLFGSYCFAEVTSEIIGKEIDQNGNILIKTQYKIDGVEVQSRYPVDAQGRYYWVTRYSVQNFYGMDATQIQARIDKDLTAFGEQLILKPFQQEVVDSVKAANQTFFDTNLGDVIGHIVTTPNAKLLVDTDFNGVPDEEWTCLSNGEKTTAPYTPTP